MDVDGDLKAVHLKQLADASVSLSSKESTIFQALLSKVATNLIEHQRLAGEIPLTPLHGTSLSPSAEAQRKLDSEFKAVAELSCSRSPAFDLPDALKSDCANTDPYMDMREVSGAAR
eukprot:12417815-Karenia_brevis.AAC.1